MLAVKLWGGLGNQMFQYAFGKHLEVLRCEKVSFYTVPILYDLHLDLLSFSVNLERTGMSQIKKHLILSARELPYRIERKLVQKYPFLNPTFYVETSLHYNPEIEKSSAILYDGYWQSYKYFDGISGLIVSEFQLKNDVVLNLDSLLSHIKTSNSVSVHVRRGDYLVGKNQQLFAQCGKGYYEKAFERINQIVADPVFYLFSNDIEWAKKELATIDRFELNFIDNSGSRNRSLADFMLMSRCKHHIIANSTFSWWAAWLNQNQNKMIIAPKQWYKGRLNDTTTDLIPTAWIRL